jgi:hypothetical protein
MFDPREMFVHSNPNIHTKLSTRKRLNTKSSLLI